MGRLYSCQNIKNGKSKIVVAIKCNSEIVQIKGSNSEKYGLFKSIASKL